RHAHADAPGGVPRRGHLRPARAGGRRPRAAPADHGAAAERPGAHRTSGWGPRLSAGHGAGHRGGAGMTTLDFALPPELEASEPPPARDGVRLLVASGEGMQHARFGQLGEFLAPGDLMVV